MFLLSKQHRDIIYYKARVHLRSEASSTYLSYLWWIFEPIISLGIYYLIFGVIFASGTEDFIPFLIIGLVTWQWFNNIVSHCANSINGNIALITNVSFPKVILPSVNIVMDSVKYSVVFMILLVFLWIYGFTPTWTYLYLPLVILCQHLFNTMIGNLVAAVVPFAPDLKIIITNILRIAFYMSGIMYSISDLPEHLQFYFEFNPMAQIIHFYRDILMHSGDLNVSKLMFYIAICFFGVIVSHLILRKLDPIYPRVLLQK
ncbi:ABC transporter permease [Vibrio hangzhouensis]|uniref:ABC transporter permease n=1 Tax=Vibrio hangzhouensis TaxID=462991 RepID=UPI001C98383E|nr:ABC transporter permease [Vibrio hangzhouensis]